MSPSFNFPLQLSYGDCPPNGAVHHPFYLDFMERARMSALAELGFDLPKLAELDLIVAVAHIDVEFLRPVSLEMKMQVVSVIEKIGGASVSFNQIICPQASPEEIFCRGRIKTVLVNAKMRPQKVPSQLIKELERE